MPFVFNRFKILLLVAVLLIALSPFWVFKNWYSILNTLLPFDNLNNKIVVDGINIVDFTSGGDIDEIFLVDTTILAIRQLTNDNFIDRVPKISLLEKRIYFESNRSPNNESPYGGSTYFHYYYDLQDQTIKPANP